MCTELNNTVDYFKHILIFWYTVIDCILYWLFTVHGNPLQRLCEDPLQGHESLPPYLIHLSYEFSYYYIDQFSSKMLTFFITLPQKDEERTHFISPRESSSCALQRWLPSTTVRYFTRDSFWHSFSLPDHITNGSSAPPVLGGASAPPVLGGASDTLRPSTS